MEIEIKLAPVLPHQAQAILSDAAIAPYLGPTQRVRMNSRYFDTQGLALRAQKYTLRLRQETPSNGSPAARSVCTFKGPVDSKGARLELEAPAETLEAGIAALLNNPALPADAAQILRRGGLECIATVSFVRDRAQWHKGELSFELAHDQGQAQRGARTGAINEVELELLSGDRSAMEAIARELCDRHGLTAGKLSKLRQALSLGERDGGQTVSPFFVSNELLNYCVRMKWLNIEMDDQNRLHYRLSEEGARELPARFGVDFGKPCAFAGEDA